MTRYAAINHVSSGGVSHRLVSRAVLCMIVPHIQVLGRVSAAISAAIGCGCFSRRVCIVVLTSMRTLCITTSLCISRSVLLKLSLSQLASLVFLDLSIDDFAGFGNLVSNAVFFVGACLPGFVVLPKVLARCSVAQIVAGGSYCLPGAAWFQSGGSAPC